jgi:hypothetical protein
MGGTLVLGQALPGATAFALAVLAALPVACGGSDAPSIDARDAGSGAAPSLAHEAPLADAAGSAAEGSDASPGAAACNTLVDDGAYIISQMVAADAPTLAGGAIADGTYHLTSLTFYTGPGGRTGPVRYPIRGTLVFEGSGFEIVGAEEEPGSVTERRTMTFSTSGPTITYEETCPTPYTATTTYAADGSSFMLAEPGSDTVVWTFAR